MNGKDLSRVQSLTEDVNGSELPTEHPVSIRSLWRAQETFIITLQEGREEEEIIKIKKEKKKKQERYQKWSFYQFNGLRVFWKGPLELFTCYLLVILFWIVLASLYAITIKVRLREKDVLWLIYILLIYRDKCLSNCISFGPNRCKVEEKKLILAMLRWSCAFWGCVWKIIRM